MPVGNVTNAVVTNLTSGATYYFVVTARNLAGLESLPSNEVSYSVPSNPPGGTDPSPVLTVPASIAATVNTATPVSGVSVADAAVGAGNITLNFSANRGILTVLVNVASGVTSGQILGNNSGNVFLTAPLTALNATLSAPNGVTYTGNLNLVGSDNLTVSASDNGSTGSGSTNSASQQVPITVTGAAIDTWRNQNFSASSLSDPAQEATVWGDLADPDQDGVNNLLEYALHSNPNSRESISASIFTGMLITNAVQYQTLSFKRLKNEPSLQYVPEVSGDKSTWAFGTNTVRLLNITNIDATMEWAVFQDLTPVAPGNARFMRLRVIRN